MVRLEIIDIFDEKRKLDKFTFQYGQIRNNVNSSHILQMALIYIPVWLDQKFNYKSGWSEMPVHLHSSMVRLEIRSFCM